MNVNNYCFTLKSNIAKYFRTIFKTNTVFQHEWDTVWQSTFAAKQSLQLIEARLANLHQISRLKWQNPVHVVARCKRYQNYTSLSNAVADFAKAKSYYEFIFGKYIKGNFIVACEIGYTGNEHKQYDIHVHIICEMVEYQFYLNETSFMRSGSNPKHHHMSSRICPRKQSQTNSDYVLSVSNYINKFALFKGHTNRKIVTSHEKTIEYLKCKSNSLYIQAVNIKNCSKHIKQYYKSYKRIKQYVFRYLKWSLLKTVNKYRYKQIENTKTLNIIEKSLKKLNNWFDELEFDYGVLYNTS